MTRDELLTKLAMQMPPESMERCGNWVTWNGGSWIPALYGGEHKFTRYQYDQRRAELINEPDDADAPEWARWKAQANSGIWYWSKEKPFVTHQGLITTAATERASVGKIPAGHDWRTTLREVNRDISRNEPHGITGVKHRVERQLNPHTSSITDSQAREFAEESGMCSDGSSCGIEGVNGEPQYCDDCPNAPHQQDARRLDAQLTADIGAISDKINPNHYRKGDIECIDAIKAATVGKAGIEAACVANVIKYLWRYEEKNGIEDIEKALWYINRLHDEVHD